MKRVEYFLFFVGFLLIVAVIFLTAEVRRLGAQLKQEQTGTERSFSAIEMAFEEMMEQLERRGSELLEELNAARAVSGQESVDPPAPEARSAPQPEAISVESEQPVVQRDEPVEPASTGQAPRHVVAAADPSVEPGEPEVASVELPEAARRARVLVDQGLNTVEIARALGVGRGEVQLLLALERSQRRGA